MRTGTSSEPKTPVSHLQELCTKWGISPTYQLVNVEGPVHEPLFEYTIVAGEYTATGKGASKKKARHTAAEALLMTVNKDRQGTNGEMIPLDNSVRPQSSGDDSEGPPARGRSAPNPVGRLQEFLQKNHLPPAYYEYSGECGPPHSRVFVCTVQIQGITQNGTGPSKKVAKKVAATTMLQYLSADPSLLSADSAALQTMDPQLSKILDEFKMGERKTDTLGPEASQKINQFYVGLKSKTGKTLASLQSLSLNVPATNYCQMLAEIAEEQEFSVNYVDHLELTLDGQYQCLVQLSTMPVAVCYSTGRSRDEAHTMAAHNALQYLKIMTRKA